ncbi:MAG TPA: hypothetical protein VHC22_01625 [Pirellulales bacterium]|nr:hypothetical protein [Pirellulales bacterium]
MPQKPPGDQLTFRGTFNLLCIVCDIHSRMVTPFLRASTGSRARGLFTFIAGAIIFYLAHALNSEPLIKYWAAWLVAVVVQMADSSAANKKQVIHSQYAGCPRLAMLICPFVKSEETAKFAIEPFLCLGVGYGLLQWSDVVGKLVMSTAFSLMFLGNYDRHVRQRREQELIDARLEGEFLSNQVRERF